MANANVPLAGYETVFGNKKAMVVDHYGPAVYATGGETFEAKSLGWGGIDFIVPGNRARVQTLSFSRNFSVTVAFDTTAVGAVPHVTIIWYTIFGPEVTAGVDLSGEKIRLFVLGV